MGMNKTEIHNRLMADREIIIQKDKQEIPIVKIAQDYGVSFTTIYSLLRKWGRKRDFKRKYFKLPKDQKTEKEERLIAFKKNLSPEARTRMDYCTRTNNKYIKHYKVIETAHEKFLIRGILKKSGWSNE